MQDLPDHHIQRHIVVCVCGTFWAVYRKQIQAEMPELTKLQMLFCETEGEP